MDETIYAKDAVPGRWYEFQGLRCLFVTMSNGEARFANRYGTCESFSPDLRVTPLPECTGWDWQPTSKHPSIPDPGEGWRLLEPGEVTKYGDDVLFSGRWQPVVNSAYIGIKANASGFLYRRRIEPTYRPFASQSEAEPFYSHRVKSKRTGEIFRIVGMGDSGVIIGVHSYTYKEAHEEYVFDDGSPFGVKVEP